MLEAVFFDMDNTLVNSEWAAARAVRNALARYGRELSKADEEAVIGLPWETIFANTVRDYSLPIGIERLRDEILAEKAAILEGNLTALPGAVEAVKLCAQHWPVAVVSGSYRREIDETLSQIGVQEWVRFFVANDDISPGKPAPDPYLEAARQLGVDPTRCLVFEDSEMGVCSAKAAGMTCVAVAYANETGMDLGGADLVIPSLETVTNEWLETMPWNTEATGN